MAKQTHPLGPKFYSKTKFEFVQSTSGSKAMTFPFGYDLAIGGGEFYAKVDIGTPGQYNYMMFDTGSDITWIQWPPHPRDCTSNKCFHGSGSTGYITFGKPDDLNNKCIKFTTIPATPQQSQFYDVVIIGISVDGKKLPIKSLVYTKGGAVIDSGTVITCLQPNAYAVLRLAFRKAMSRYTMAALDGNTNTCYDFSNYETVVVPKVSFFFKGGVELEMDLKGIFLPNSVGIGGDRSEVVAAPSGTMKPRGFVQSGIAGSLLAFSAGVCALCFGHIDPTYQSFLRAIKHSPPSAKLLTVKIESRSQR
ncbi:hypothetical protein ACOSP7_007988 [Xanthoceras sorbifolium]